MPTPASQPEGQVTDQIATGRRLGPGHDGDQEQAADQHEQLAGVGGGGLPQGGLVGHGMGKDADAEAGEGQAEQGQRIS